MREIKAGDNVVYQNATIKEENKMDHMSIIMIKVKEVKDETFIAEKREDELFKYRVKHVIEGKKFIVYEGYNFHKIAVEEGDLLKEDYEKLKEIGRAN